MQPPGFVSPLDGTIRVALLVGETLQTDMEGPIKCISFIERIEHLESNNFSIRRIVSTVLSVSKMQIKVNHLK